MNSLDKLKIQMFDKILTLVPTTALEKRMVNYDLGAAVHAIMQEFMQKEVFLPKQESMLEKAQLVPGGGE